MKANQNTTINSSFTNIGHNIEIDLNVGGFESNADKTRRRKHPKENNNTQRDPRKGQSWRATRKQKEDESLILIQQGQPNFPNEYSIPPKHANPIRHSNPTGG